MSAGRMLNNLLRVERRHFLKQVAAASFAAGVPTHSAIGQGMSEQGSATVGDRQVSLSDTLALYATGLRYEDLPEDVIRIAKRAILDTVGCAFGGYTGSPSKIAIKLAGDVNARQGATVLLSGIRTSPDLAEFANGVRHC